MTRATIPLELLRGVLRARATLDALERETHAAARALDASPVSLVDYRAARARQDMAHMGVRDAERRLVDAMLRAYGVAPDAAPDDLERALAACMVPVAKGGVQ